MRMPLFGFAMMATLLLSSPLAAIGQASAPSAPAPDDSAKMAQQRRDTIQYGIDSEIINLINTLDGEKNGDFNADLATLLAESRSPKLRSAIVGFFADLQWNGAEKSALSIVADRDLNDPGLVFAALSYLAAIRSKEALRFSTDIVKEDNKKLMPAVVRLLGRAGGAAEEDQLLAWLDSDSFDQNLKEEAIKALGEIGSAKAAARLNKLIEDPEGSKMSRIFACQSLARIKDSSSVASLVKAANGDDPNVRAAAVEVLAAFSTPEADSAIVQALRDSFVGVRLAACKGVGSRKIASAFPFLRYKATSDPEEAVKTEAYRSLALLGGQAFSFLLERVQDQSESDVVRALCFGLLARKDPGSIHSLAVVLTKESASNDRALYTSFAREIANASDAPDAGSLAMLLLGDKDYLIRIAGIEWIRKNKAGALRPQLEQLAKSDPSEMIRKRAADALASF